jgi:ligand-binding SRPBCC domain-containing protein
MEMVELDFSNPSLMKTYHLHTRMDLLLPRDRVFAFFSDAANLERITPRELGFAIATKLPIAMHEGTLIDYTIRVWGVPMTWKTRIARWSPPDVFVDEQLSGPYKKWVHTHRFLDAPNGGTIIEDHVEYAMPFGVLGRVAAPVIRLQLNRIFRHRQSAVAAALSSA